MNSLLLTNGGGGGALQAIGNQQQELVEMPGDLDAIVDAADVEDYAFIEQSYSSTSGAAQASGKSRGSSSVSADLRVLVTKNYQKPRFGSKTETDQRYGFVIASVERRPEKDSEEASGLTGVTLESDPSMSWKLSACPANGPMEKSQRCFTLLDKLATDCKKKNKPKKGESATAAATTLLITAASEDGDGDGMDVDAAAPKKAALSPLDEIVPLLETANLSSNIRKQCLHACTFRNIPRWGPNYRPKGKDETKEKKPVTDDKSTYYADPLPEEELPGKVAEFLQERIVADLVVTLIKTFVDSHETVTIKPRQLIECKHRAGNDSLPRFGVLDLIGFHYGVMIDPVLPTYLSDKPGADMIYTGRSIHKTVTFYTYESHEILYSFGDALMKSWRIHERDFAARLQSYSDLVQRGVSELTVRVYPMPVCDILLAQPSGQTLGFDLLPDTAFDDEGMYKTAKGATPSKLCFRGKATGQQWEYPLTLNKNSATEGKEETTFNLSSTACYVMFTMWSDLLSPMFGIHPEETEFWEKFLPIFFRSSEMIITGGLDDGNSKSLITNKRNLPRNVKPNDAAAFFTKFGKKAPETEDPEDALFVYPTITCKTVEDKATAVNLFKDGHGNEPVVLALNVKSILFDLASALRRYAMPITKEVAMEIHKKWVQSAPIRGVLCNDPDVIFLSTKAPAGGKAAVDSINESDYEFRVWTSKMTTSDHVRLGRTKLTAEKFSRAFHSDCFSKTDAIKRATWLEQNGLGELANYAFLNPETVKQSKFAIYAIKRTTENPKDKIATDLRNIAALINPVIKKSNNNNKKNGTSTPPMAIADAPTKQELKALPVPPKSKATIEDIEDVAPISTTTTTKNKKKRERDDLVLKGDVAERTAPAPEDTPSKKAKEEKEEPAEEAEAEDAMEEEEEQQQDGEEEAQTEEGEDEVPASQLY